MEEIFEGNPLLWVERLDKRCACLHGCKAAETTGSVAGGGGPGTGFLTLSSCSVVAAATLGGRAATSRRLSVIGLHLHRCTLQISSFVRTEWIERLQRRSQQWA